MPRRAIALGPAKNYSPAKGEFEIITQWLADGTTQLPNSTLSPKQGDATAGGIVD